MDLEPGWELRRVAENGARLRELRLERRLSQKQLADEAGVNVSQVSRVEEGRDSQLSTFLKLYAGLGYRIDLELFEICDEAGDLLDEESQRRKDRRLAGMLSGKRWR
ncbi:MAG: helix-turn-helix transcriptional regulator [Elusimicrobia bacterium]|nr:helix-turn-helix transcriptional regulator [Elusimicrobiota bacterium]MDE2512061.1 helix-turn-helix transcriptional regulator [Elusimicrobiota bacterium]